MTCCKSTSTGVGIPPTAPSNNDPDIYIEQPSGQIWVWNGTSWVKPPVGSVSYNSTTRVLTVGSSQVTLPIASSTEYGVVKLANPTAEPTNPIVVDPSTGTLTINCTKLIAHCGLATNSALTTAIASALNGETIVNILSHMTSTELNGLACALVDNTTPALNGLQCTGSGLSTKQATTTQVGSVRYATAEEIATNTGNGVITASSMPKAVAYSLLNGVIVQHADSSVRRHNITASMGNGHFANIDRIIHSITVPETGVADIYSQVSVNSPDGTYVEHHQDIYITRAGVRTEVASSYGAYKIYSGDLFTVPATLLEVQAGDILELELSSFSDTSHAATLTETYLRMKYYS